MQKNDHNECPFSDEIISYMYDEMPLSERAKFENHLSKCQLCTDDFAAVSVARFETYDWKRTEFDTLPTPRIVIPYKEKAPTFGERVFAWVRWGTVLPASAVLVMSLSIAFLVINNKTGKTDGAVADIPQRSQPSAGRQTPEVRKPIAPVISTSVGPGKVNSRIEHVASTKKPALPKSQVAKRVSPGIRPANDLAVNILPDRPKRAPRLGMNDIEDDRSLRLSDLFDEANPPQR